MPASCFIAVVDDDASLRMALESLFKSFDLRAATFCCAEDLLSSKELTAFSCFMTDVLMPSMDGFDMVERLRKKNCDQPIIFMTAHKQEGYSARAHALGATCLLSKPFTTEEVMTCIGDALGLDFDTEGLAH